MTKEEVKELEKALKDVTEDGVLLQDVLFKVLQVNGYVSVYHNDKYVIIENTKKGTRPAIKPPCREGGSYQGRHLQLL